MDNSTIIWFCDQSQAMKILKTFHVPCNCSCTCRTFAFVSSASKVSVMAFSITRRSIVIGFPMNPANIFTNVLRVFKKIMFYLKISNPAVDQVATKGSEFLLLQFRFLASSICWRSICNRLRNIQACKSIHIPKNLFSY